MGGDNTPDRDGEMVRLMGVRSMEPFTHSWGGPAVDCQLRGKVSAIRWPLPGGAELTSDVELNEREGSDVIIEVVVSVTSTGTERARFLGMPNAGVQFPHHPGYMAAGVVVAGGDDLPPGTAVAARGVPHQSRAVVRRSHVHRIPLGVSLSDGALWELALTALHALDRGAYDPSEPLALIGAGLLGTLTRRLATGRGLSTCVVVATSDAKKWATVAENGTRFLLSTSSAIDLEAEAYPLVIDATGSPDGLMIASRLVAAGGRVVLLGSPRAATGAVPIRDIQRRGICLIGAHVSTLGALDAIDGTARTTRLTEEFFSLLEGGSLSFQDVLNRFPPSDAARVYQEMASQGAFIAAAFDWPPNPEWPPWHCAAPTG